MNLEYLDVGVGYDAFYHKNPNLVTGSITACTPVELLGGLPGARSVLFWVCSEAFFFVSLSYGDSTMVNIIAYASILNKRGKNWRSKLK